MVARPWAYLRTILDRAPVPATAEPIATPVPPEKLRDFPAVETRHVAQDARLFANREDLLLALWRAEAPVIAEIGVGLGGFSEFVLDRLKPSRFVAIDTFILHTLPVLWDQPTAELFKGRTHREYYERRLAAHAGVLDVREGDSHDCLAAFPDHHFDLIYVDADHRYEGVKHDLAQAVRTCRPDGLLIMNDYVLLDHGGNQYGVVPAVNELLAGGGWQIVGFALQHLMYCDIALRRQQTSGE